MGLFDGLVNRIKYGNTESEPVGEPYEFCPKCDANLTLQKGYRNNLPYWMCKCGFSLDDYSKNVFGQLDNIENRIDSTLEEWAKTLLDTISDTLVAGAKEYLNADQKKAVEDFISAKAFPDKVDDFFVKAISQLLQGFEPVVIDADEMVKELEALPPMDEDGFVKKLKEMLTGYTKGKDASKLRIVVKRKI